MSREREKERGQRASKGKEERERELFRVGFGENSRNGGNLLYTSQTNSLGYVECGQLTKGRKEECS